MKFRKCFILFTYINIVKKEYCECQNAKISVIILYIYTLYQFMYLRRICDVNHT